MSNGAYPQSKEGIKARKELLDQLNSQIDEMVQSILEPEDAIDYDVLAKTNPFYAQAQAGLEKAKWDFLSGKKVLED